MTDKKPAPPLTLYGAVDRKKENQHAKFVTVVFVDSAGEYWAFEASCFNFNMKPVHDMSLWSK